MIYVSPEMLPAAPAKGSVSSGVFSDEGVSVAPVSGIGSSNLRALGGSLGLKNTAQIWGQTFREALFQALTDSAVFARIQHDGEARYALNAEILHQDVAGAGARFGVRYALLDTSDQHQIWNRDIETDYHDEGEGPAIFANFNTQLLALMHACRGNLASLVEALRGLSAASAGDAAK